MPDYTPYFHVQFFPMRQLLILLFILPLTALSAQDGGMNNARLDTILRSLPLTLEGQPGRWEFTLAETQMLCLTDEKHDRMRIIAPVKLIAEASGEEIRDCMEANFHSALDVKYAIADDLIWVAFIHPLSPLTDEQFIDAITQVRSAVVTFGTTYTSTDLVFPGGRKAPEKPAKKPLQKL